MSPRPASHLTVDGAVKSLRYERDHGRIVKKDGPDERIGLDDIERTNFGKTNSASRQRLPGRLGLLDRLLLRLKFGLELPFSFKPVTDIVTMITTARDIDFKCAVGNL